MDAIVFGDGPLGLAIADQLRHRGGFVRRLGRPAAGHRHPPAELAAGAIVFEASRGEAVRANIDSALEAGCRHFVIATTGWDADRDQVARALTDAGAAAVVAANFSLGAALFLRLVDSAAALFGVAPEFDPFISEWHRRGKRDRPSGTARELARRITAAKRAGPGDQDIEVASLRAGSSPGAHLVGFDAPGETVELRLTARDRSPYASGALLAADWLRRSPRAAGIHPWDAVVDDLLNASQPVPAFA